MNKENHSTLDIKNTFNEKIIFNNKIAQETANLILETGSYSVNFDKPREDWIKLPDGSITPCYCNCRYINSDPEATKIIGKNFSNMIKNNFPNVELIVGLETAGISWGSKIASELCIPFAYARGKSKGYGMGKLIECNPPKKLKTVIIDDAYFTGESVVKAVEAIKNELETNILGVGVITNLSNLDNNGNYLNLKNSEIPVFTLTDYSFILKKLEESKRIDKNQFLNLEKYYNDPKGFFW